MIVYNFARMKFVILFISFFLSAAASATIVPVFMDVAHTSTSQDSVLIAGGVGSCIVVDIYDSETGAEWMAHVSATQDVKKVVAGARDFFGSYRSGRRLSDLDVRVGGGWVGWSEEPRQELIDELRARGFRRPIVSRMLNLGFSVRQFRQGAFLPAFKKLNFDPYRNFRRNPIDGRLIEVVVDRWPGQLSR